MNTRYEKVQLIIKEILKNVMSHDDWDIMDVWLAYRILAIRANAYGWPNGFHHRGKEPKTT